LRRAPHGYDPPVKRAWQPLALTATLASPAGLGLGLGPAAAPAASAAALRAPAPKHDPLCLSSYRRAPSRPARRLRFGIDPGLAGSAGAVQLPAVPDDRMRDLAAVEALAPAGRALVVRLNRLFWSAGEAGIARFRRLARTYTRAGFEVEIQVRYHPSASEIGKIAAWDRWVRHVVDSFGRDRRVVAMTITNEVNVQISPNTSDGYYSGAANALTSGIEAAHDEAVRKRFRQLRFGFTYAYRFVPAQDAAFFSYLRAHGGPALRRALGFVGLDFYPGSVYPPTIPPGDSYRSELAQAVGVLRGCLAPIGGIGAKVPIWITENGVSTGARSERQQAAALDSLVQAAHDYSRTYNITDYRWFNLRDSVPAGATAPGGLTFATDGLLRSDYGRKPAFDVYRELVARLGASVPGSPRDRTTDACVSPSEPTIHRRSPSRSTCLSPG
jgi:hypothetical protein